MSARKISGQNFVIKQLHGFNEKRRKMHKINWNPKSFWKYFFVFFFQLGTWIFDVYFFKCYVLGYIFAFDLMLNELWWVLMVSFSLLSGKPCDAIFRCVSFGIYFRCAAQCHQATIIFSFSSFQHLSQTMSSTLQLNSK